MAGRPREGTHKKVQGIDYFSVILDYQVFRDLKRLSGMEHLTPNKFLKEIMPFLEKQVIDTIIARNKFIAENCQGENLFGGSPLLEGDEMTYRIIDAKVRDQVDEYKERRKREKHREEANDLKLKGEEAKKVHIEEK